MSIHSFIVVDVTDAVLTFTDWVFYRCRRLFLHPTTCHAAALPLPLHCPSFLPLLSLPMHFPVRLASSWISCLLLLHASVSLANHLHVPAPSYAGSLLVHLDSVVPPFARHWIHTTFQHFPASALPPCPPATHRGATYPTTPFGAACLFAAEGGGDRRASVMEQD